MRVRAVISLYGYDKAAFEEVGFAIRPPFQVLSSPLVGQNFSDFEICSPAGRVMFAVGSSINGKNIIEYISVNVETNGPQREKTTQIDVFVQGVFFDHEVPQASSVVGINPTGLSRQRIKQISDIFVVSGLRIKSGDSQINICLSDYEDALFVTETEQDDFWKNHTLLASL